MKNPVLRAGRALVFLALDLWIGVAGLLLVAVGMSLAIAFAVTVVPGAFFAGGTLRGARALGSIQLTSLGLAAGPLLSPAAPAVHRDGFWGRLTGPMRDPAGWKAFAYWWLELPLALLSFAVVFGSISAGLVALTLPLYASRLDGVGADVPSAGLALGSVLGAVVVVAGLAAGPVALRVHGALAQALLGRDRTEQLRARVTDLDTARAAALEAADTERRRIERDLHDGTQQRLVALAMDLGMAKEKLDTDPETAHRLVTDAHREVKETMAELRSLTRGLRPSVLEDRGLDAALSAVAARCPVPVDIDVSLDSRPPPTAESAAYFAASEALTNVAKHAGATRAKVRITREGAVLVVEVSDDGRGQARVMPGGGLAGLVERLAGFEGRLSIDSPAGGPTVIRAEVPCES